LKKKCDRKLKKARKSGRPEDLQLVKELIEAIKRVIKKERARIIRLK
jgi:hypothetical protein